MAQTWDSIIDGLGGTGAVASALGLADSVVSGWRRRGIPGLRWVALAEIAANRGCREITIEAMASLASERSAVGGECAEARA